MKATRTITSVVGVLAAALFAAAPAQAQRMSPGAHFGATAGLNVPLSDLSSTDNSGYYLAGMVTGTPSGSPLELRGEVSYSGFGAKRYGGNDNIAGFTGNVVYPLEQGSGTTPYLIGGIGLYHISWAGGIASENDFGFNIGGGLQWQLGDMRTFAEVRYHYVGSSGASTQMLPITFGVIF